MLFGKMYIHSKAQQKETVAITAAGKKNEPGDTIWTVVHNYL